MSKICSGDDVQIGSQRLNTKSIDCENKCQAAPESRQASDRTGWTSQCMQSLHRREAPVSTSINYIKSKGQRRCDQTNTPVCEREKVWDDTREGKKKERERDVLAPVSAATCLSGDSAHWEEAETIMRRAWKLILWLTYSALPPPPLLFLPAPASSPHPHPRDARLGTLAYSTVYRSMLMTLVRELRITSTFLDI